MGRQGMLVCALAPAKIPRSLAEPLVKTRPRKTDGKPSEFGSGKGSSGCLSWVQQEHGGIEGRP